MTPAAAGGDRRRLSFVAGAAALFPLILLVAGLRLVGQARDDSLTYDERAYIYSGRCLVDTGRDLDPRQPAGFRVMAGLGTRVFSAAGDPPCHALSEATNWFAAQGGGLQQLIASARVPTVLVGIMLMLTVAAWAGAAYGPLAAVVAAAVAGFEPTLLAHLHLATPDALLTFGLVLSLAAHWAWDSTRNRAWLAVAAVGLAAAMLAKVIALEVLPLLLLASGLSTWLRRRHEPVTGGGGGRTAVLAIAAVAAIGAGAWLLLCLAYLPLLPAGATPLDLLAPPQWLHSLGYQLSQARNGTTNYLNGSVYRGPNPLYFLEALALKTSLPLLLLAALAAFRARRGDTPATGHLVAAAAFIVLVPSVGGIDIGVRYVLALYPLLAMAAGSIAVGWMATPARLTPIPLAGALLLLLLVVESLVHGGDSIGYFNQIAGARPERYLADSNLDWGQDAWRLRDWWQAQGRPDLTTAYFGALPLSAYGVTSHELALGAPMGDGEVAASITRLVVYPQGGDGLELLRRCPDPAARVGTSIQLGRNLTHLACAD